MRYARKPVSQVRTLNYSLTALRHTWRSQTAARCHTVTPTRLQGGGSSELGAELELLPEQH